MTPPDPAKLALFIERYVRNGDAVAACVEAKLADPMYPIQVIADMLLARTDVQTAITVTRKTIAKRDPVEITRDSIIADMQNVYELACADRDPKAAIAAKRLQSELAGLLVEHVEVRHKFDVATMTDDELQRIAAGAIVDAEFTEVPQPEQKQIAG